MPDTPYPVTSDDPKQAIAQIKLLIDELFQEKLAGADIGDVFQVGDDDVFALRLSTTGGLEKTSSSLAVKVDADGGVQTGTDGVGIKVSADKGLVVDSNGIYIKIKADSGLIADTDGIYVKLKTSYGIDVDSDGLKLKKQDAEEDVDAVSAISAANGTDHLDRTAFNTALETLVTEINAIKTKLNNIITKLESAEILTA